MTQRGKERLREAAIAALLNAKTIREAATVCGLSERTLKRWLKTPGFAAEYSEAKTALLQAATGKLRREASAAVDVLSEVAADALAAPGARATAARSILELALRAHETEVLEARIAALESGANDGD